MKRANNIKRVDAILCSDIHLRESAPVCFKEPDVFFTEQWDALQTLKELQEKHNCPVYCGGDLFDYWKPSPWLLSKTIEHLPKEFYTVIGNHDVPQHNLDLIDKCGVNVLAKAGKLAILNETHFGTKPTTVIDLIGKGLIVWHVMVWDGKNVPYQTFDETTSSAKKLLKKYKEADVMLTGDNHLPFVVEHKGAVLINPGSLTRQKADQIDYQPRVYLWYNDNTVEPFYMPIDKKAITREHLEDEEERNERLEAFISKLNTEGLKGLSFEENLQRFYKENKIKKKVIKTINKTM